MDNIQDVTAQCPQDLALVKKYINQVQSAILKIQQDENITDLKFVDYLELNELKCKKCHYLNFQSVPKKQANSFLPSRILKIQLDQNKWYSQQHQVQMFAEYLIFQSQVICAI
ncbi:Hypothetical_protein [Hexamita inflata]|uniref:Hypothetical_protein n=1 Tax=Hexamita inflata TaxID=28002 RepID=A0AA86V453_9EUKA|nr:Hypothetical protein HINF_LOCUS63436 [Hexamita inflata]